MKRLFVVAALGVAAAVPAHAKPTWMKRAQAEDPSLKDCTACHLTQKGKDLNDRGKFLADRKKELGVPEVDLKWLHDYKAPDAATQEPTATPAGEPTEAKK